MKVLVVDDGRANRQLLSFMLADDGYEVVEAGDGQEGIEVFKDENPDLVLMDVMMPIMNGYDSAKEIKKLCGSDHVPIIFLTALNDEASLTKCLEVGGDDFLSKPFDDLILSAKIKAHGRIRELNKKVNEQNAELIYHHNTAQREQEIVEHVFNHAILNSNHLSSSNINYHLSPVSAFNGDIFLVAPGPSGSLYIMLGDFTGHGLPAAIGALPVSNVFFTMSKKGMDIGDIVEEVNSALLKFLPPHMFLVANVMELNAKGDVLTVWSGGMNEAYIIGEDGVVKGTIESDHMPLGVLEPYEFERDVKLLKMSVNDRIYFHTDGIVESANEVGEMYGCDRLEKVIYKSKEKVLDKVLEDLKKFIGGAAQDDDISIFELTCKPVERKNEEIDDRRKLKAMPWKVSIELDQDDIRDVDPVPQMISMLSDNVGLTGHKDYIHTILSEMYSNALEHGVLGLKSSLKDGSDGFVEYYQLRDQRIEALVDASITIDLKYKPKDKGGMLTLRIKDSGEGFDVDDIKPPVDDDTDDSFGRGIRLISSLCQNLEYKEGGTSLEAQYIIQ